MSKSVRVSVKNSFERSPITYTTALHLLLVSKTNISQVLPKATRNWNWNDYI